MKEQKARIAVFIDAGNLWNVYKDLGRFLNLKVLKAFFEKKFNADCFNIFYYVAYPLPGTRSKEDLDGLHRFFTYLKKSLGFIVVKKPLKRIAIANSETQMPQYFEKGNFDVELTIDAMRYLGDYDMALLLSGDSDFLPLIKYLQNMKPPKEIYVFSTKSCISKELRISSNGYFDFSDYPEIHGNSLVSKVNKK